MTTIDDVIVLQQSSNILQAPTDPSVPQTIPLGIASVTVPGAANNTAGVSARSLGARTTPSTFTLNLYNSCTTNIYAFVTGISGVTNQLCLIQADGVSLYYPASPSSTVQPLAVNCAIPLGAPGTSKSVTVPYLYAARIWFSINNPLQFFLNPGPGLVEPSVSNPSDVNYMTVWDFCEFTFNTAQIYANISYVDFVSLPVSLTLTNTSGATQHVSGIPSNGLALVCNALIAQNNSDGAGWNQCVVTNSAGVYIRAISPDQVIALTPTAFSSYWTSYINSAWAKYQSTTLTVDTQYTWGVVTGTSNGTTLNFGSYSFTKPDALDIFGANSGPFANGDAEFLNIGARIDAAINRGTLITDASQPDGETVASYYTNSVCNWYSKIVHSINLDGRGYCFPYDDVVGPKATDQSGFVSDGAPQTLTVSIGGAGAYAKKREVKQEFREAARLGRRDFGGWLEDVKAPTSMSDVPYHQPAVVQMGDRKLANEASEFMAVEGVRRCKLPPAIEKVVGPVLEKFYSSPFYQHYLLPFLVLLHQFIVAALSLSIRTVVSRVFIVLCFFLFYFLGLLPHGSTTEVGSATQRVMEASNVLGNVTLVQQGN